LHHYYALKIDFVVNVVLKTLRPDNLNFCAIFDDNREGFHIEVFDESGGIAIITQKFLLKTLCVRTALVFFVVQFDHLWAESEET
jgi:hypothetical protein